MTDILKELGVDAKVYEEIEEQTVSEGFEPIKSGIYKAKIKELATFKSSKGAGMLKGVFTIETDDEPREITMYTNIIKKDGETNKYGLATFKHIQDALDLEEGDMSIKEETISGYGKDVDGKVIKGINKKKILVYVREVFEEGAAFEKYNEIEAYSQLDGTNSKGEDLKEAFTSKIEKKEILIRKSKDAPASKSNSSSSETEDSIKDML